MVGAGALGQSFAALLARAGVPVTLFARTSTAQRLIAAQRLRIIGALDMQIPLVRISGAPAPRATVGLASSPSDIPVSSGLMFTTKAHQLSAAVDQLHSVPCAWVLGMQNGLQKDDVLKTAYGAHRLVGAATILSAQRAADDSVVVSSTGATYLGELDPAAAECAEDAFSVLIRTGVKVERESDVRRVLWSKACNAVGIFGVCVLARCGVGRMFATPSLVRAFLPLIRETAQLARAYGVEVADYPGFPIRTYVERPDGETIAILGEQGRAALASAGPVSYPSMVQDLLAGRRLEVEGVFGDLVERARCIDLEVPRIGLVCELLRGIDLAQAAE